MTLENLSYFQGSKLFQPIHFLTIPQIKAYSRTFLCNSKTYQDNPLALFHKKHNPGYYNFITSQKKNINYLLHLQLELKEQEIMRKTYQAFLKEGIFWISEHDGFSVPKSQTERAIRIFQQILAEETNNLSAFSVNKGKLDAVLPEMKNITKSIAKLHSLEHISVTHCDTKQPQTQDLPRIDSDASEAQSTPTYVLPQNSSYKPVWGQETLFNPRSLISKPKKMKFGDWFDMLIQQKEQENETEQAA